MTKIIIRRVGNRALYRSLYESIDATTEHRTPTGATRRLVNLAREGRKLGTTVGQWGHIEIEIDGIKLQPGDVTAIFYSAYDAVDPRNPAFDRLDAQACVYKTLKHFVEADQ